MMNPASQKLLQIARELAEFDPISAVELERNVLAVQHTSVINPGAKKFEDSIEKSVAVLKSLVQDIDQGLEEISGEDAKQFAKFFEDVLDAEREQLESTFKSAKSAKTAFNLA